MKEAKVKPGSQTLIDRLKKGTKQFKKEKKAYERMYRGENYLNG